MKSLIVFFIGSGVGRDRRGFESHTTDLFNHLRHESTFRSMLVKAAGNKEHNELVVPSLSRKSFTAKVLSMITGKNALVFQQISFLPGLIWLIYRHKPCTLYLGEPVLFNYLFRWRNFSSAKFRMIFYTGGNTVPLRMRSDDVLQMVTPEMKELALQRKISEEQMVILPHFVQPLTLPSGTKKELREKLQIPNDRLIILSVGALDNCVKRMNYVINEVSAIGMPYYLVLLGESESETADIEVLARKQIGSDSFFIGRMNRKQLHEYYHSADIFVLASLSEGFGLVTIEALQHGLPVIVHDYPVSRFVLKDFGIFSDLSQKGNLTRMIIAQSAAIPDDDHAVRRRNYVERRFTWNVLSEKYKDLVRRSVTLTESGN